ncbi:MAG TPA: methyltransferase [Tissierellia bacterium]|nr:methyltransferase [Tissierellia bacterium]
MPHYYSEEQQTPSEPKEMEWSFRGRTFHFLTDRGVFSKDRLDYGTYVLLDTVIDEVEAPFLDLGCGYGPVGVVVGSLRNISVDMSDVNRRALSLAEKNAKRHQVDANIFYSDGFDHNERLYKSILLNPPIRAGKDTVYRLLRESYDHLLPGGSLYIVIQKKQGLASAKKYLLTFFDEAQTLERSAGFHVLKLNKK